MRRLFAAGLLVAAMASACSAGADRPGTGAPTAPPARPGATDFDGFAAEHCAALQSLFRAYGNPDTAGLSPLMQDFATAIAQGDAATAGDLADEIRDELELGRGHARAAGGWGPATAAAADLDRFLAATEAMVDARLAAIDRGPTEAERVGQAAFEAAGGIEAWYGWLEGLRAMTDAEGATLELPPCEGVPIS